MNSMTYAEFVEYLWDTSNVYDILADEQHWDGGFNSEVWLKVTEREAKAREITLSDFGEFDYGSIFWGMYEAAEKGLS